MLKDYKEQIQDADLVLVGIGRELRADRVIDFKKAITNEHYQNLIDKEDEDSKWMRTVYEREYLLSMKETDLFKELEEVLEGKEYFVVTSNDDGLLYHTHLKKDHVTAPCGNGDFFQCSAPCDEQLYPANLGLRDLIDYYEKTMRKMDEAKSILDGLEDAKSGNTVDGDTAISNIRSKYGA